MLAAADDPLDDGGCVADAVGLGRAVARARSVKVRTPLAGSLPPDVAAGPSGAHCVELDGEAAIGPADSSRPLEAGNPCARWGGEHDCRALVAAEASVRHLVGGDQAARAVTEGVTGALDGNPRARAGGGGGGWVR